MASIIINNSSNVKGIVGGRGKSMFSSLVNNGTGSAVATKLTITTQPSATGSVQTAFSQQPIIQLRDNSNVAISQSGVPITASIATGTGTLGGITTGSTNTNGTLSFSNLSLSGSNATQYTLQFASPGLTSATSNTILVVATSSFFTPDIINNETFETATNSGFGPFTNWNFSGAPTDGPSFSGRVFLSSTVAYSGTHSLQRGFANNGSDDSARIATDHGASYDCLWFGFQFKLSTPIGPIPTTTLKFCRQYNNTSFDIPLGGLWMNADSAIVGIGLFGFCWDREDSAITTSVPVANADVIDGNWHRVEFMYCRNGAGPDPSNNPNNWPCAQFWLDGVLKAWPDGTSNIRFGGSGNNSYWLNNVLYAGERSSTAKMRMAEWAGTLNAGNTASGSMWFDNVSVSSLGRTG